MPLVINTNVSSLNSQRQLVKSGMELDQAMERLSSGKRVNNAADDAAGLAIANRMTSQIMGLNQSIRNANDGVSMIQTAEGALDETTNIIQRMRELAIQSANGIYSDADRSTLDAEVQQLKAELDRIAESTTFNGQPLLDGSLGDVTLQVGSESGDTIDLSITAMDTDSLGGGNSADVVGVPMNTTASQLGDIISVAGSGTASINGQSLGDLSSVENLNDLVNAMNERVSGVEVSSFIEVTATAAGDGVLRGTSTMTLALVDGESNSQSYVISETGSMNELVDRIAETTGGVITASINDDGRLELQSQGGASIEATYGGTASISNTGLVASTPYRAQLAFEITDESVESVDIAITGTTGGTGSGVYNTVVEGLGVQVRSDGDISGSLTTSTAITEGHLVINDVALSGMAAGGTGSQQAIALAAMINAQSAEHGVVATTSDSTDTSISLDSVDGSEISIDFTGSTATLASTGLIETNNANSVGDSIAGIDIATAAGAQDSLDVLDAALEEINAIRADLGAVNNRLEFTMSNLANVVENTEASRSRIMDADFAAESAALSRAQVLQQASQAMLAQANARPQQVLQLLQG
ncbi:MAG: flagellin [Cellvibrionaceae bacterium]